MKLISWNVNGIRAVHKKNFFFPFLDEQDPDVLFIQEIKGNVEQFPKVLAENDKYHCFYNSAEKKGYSGTGLWLKKSLVEEPEFNNVLPDDPVSNEGRLVEARFKVGTRKFAVLGAYFPNGGKSDQAWQDKLVYYEAFLKHVNQLREDGHTVIWCGDVNCAHEKIDLARPAENDGVIGFHPREREWVTKVVENGWRDVFRHLNPETKEVYSWWHYISKARDRNVGWRIDYFFCDQEQVSEVKKIEYLMNQFGSDHCPVMLDIF